MVACSSHVDNRIQELAKEAGFQMVFETPLNPEKVQNIVETLKKRDSFQII
jgi:hypothetical protein